MPRVNPIRQKKKNVSKKAALQEHVNVVSELANAPSGLTCGQRVRGDAEGARREIKRLLSRKLGRSRRFAGHTDVFPRRLRVITVQVYGTDAQALLDSGAVPNIMSPYLMKRLSMYSSGVSSRGTIRFEHMSG